MKQREQPLQIDSRRRKALPGRDVAPRWRPLALCSFLVLAACSGVLGFDDVSFRGSSAQDASAAGGGSTGGTGGGTADASEGDSAESGGGADGGTAGHSTDGSAGSAGADSGPDGLYDAAPAEAQAPVVWKVVAAGDSNTMGVGNPALSDPLSHSDQVVGYRKKLKELLAADGLAVDMRGSKIAGQSVFDDPEHEGWPGEGIDKLQARVSAKAIEAFQPDVLLLLVGSNDMWVSLDNRVPITDAKAAYWVERLGQLLDDIHTRAPLALLLVGKPATPGNSMKPLGIYRDGIDQLVALRQSQGWRIDAVDFMGVANDGVHYTVAGHEELAARWRTKLLSWLQ